MHPLAVPTSTENGPKGLRPVTLGAFCSFTSEGNINFLLNVAHYVVRHCPAARFRILGFGELYRHVVQMVDDLELASQVTVAETDSLGLLSDMDVLFFLPLQNDHFLPVLAAAEKSIPVISCEVPGIDTYIADGRTGFILPYDDTKSMGELAIRLIGDRTLREGLGLALNESLAARFSAQTVAAQYEALFWQQTLEAPWQKKSAQG